MTNERIIELLEIEKKCVLRNASGECNRYCAGCDLLQDDTELHEMYTEAIALLKAQEPRVMTLDEVQVSIDPVWLKGGMAGGTWAMMPFMREYSIEFVADGVCTVYPAFAIGEYGKTWRCWTSRPTDEQREKEPWNGQA